MARDPTDYTVEFFGIDVLPYGASEKQHASELAVSPEFSIGYNAVTRVATLYPSNQIGRARQLKNARVCLYENRASIYGGLSSSGSENGVTLAHGDRVLVPYQTTASESGIYYWDQYASKLIRSDDTIAGLGHSIFVEEGDPFAGKTFRLRAANTWRPTEGPEYVKFAYSVASGAGAWSSAILTVPFQVLAESRIYDIAVLYVYRDTSSGMTTREQRTASYVRSASVWTPVGEPLVFGPPGSLETESGMRATVSDSGIVFTAYSQPAGGATFRRRLEVTVTERRLS